MSDQDETTKTESKPFAKPVEETPKPPAKKSTKKKVATKSLEVVVINPDGSDSDEQFEVTKQTSSTIFIKRVVPDFRTIKVSGVDIQVDINELRKLPVDSTKHGKPVSLLLAAAELAE